jgi:hypothetical protein
MWVEKFFKIITYYLCFIQSDKKSLQSARNIFTKGYFADDINQQQ